MNYYNDHEPYAAQWLKNLVAAGLLPPGKVDSRDIQEVTADELREFTQCHFFAGIGGWPLALQLAGWPATRPVWTGSCPCQPFSVAGKGDGTNDHRHLWPEFRRLIAERKPAKIFGEQVASADGRKWLAGVRLDLEAMGYGVGAADLCAAGVASPHVRQRLFWVAESSSTECNGWPQSERELRSAFYPANSGIVGGIPDTYSAGRSELRGAVTMEAQQLAAECHGGGMWSDFDVIPCGDGKARRLKPGLAPLVDGIPGRVGQIRAYGNAIVPQVASEFIKAFLAVRP